MRPPANVIPSAPPALCPVHPRACSKITKGMETLHKMEALPTKREGIFVMPLNRITILSTFWYKVDRPMPMLTLPGG